jgi:hypothetical protein
LYFAAPISTLLVREGTRGLLFLGPASSEPASAWLCLTTSVGVGFNRQEAGGDSERSEAKIGQVVLKNREKTIMNFSDIQATMDE